MAAPYLVVTLVAGSCGDGDDDALPPTNSTQEAAASTGESSTDGSDSPPADLSGELLTPSDLQGEWDAPGPQSLPELDVDGTLGPVCPDGESATLDDPDNSIRAAGNASITLSALDETDLEITEALIHDDRGSVFDAFASVFGSCVGAPFEQRSDPVETVQYQQLDMTLPGDDGQAFVERWGTGGELDGGEVAYALVRAGDVLVVVSVTREGVTEPYEQELLITATTAAVARMTDGRWSPGVLDAPVAPELAAPSEVTVDGAGDIVVRPSDGCRFFEDEDHSYTLAVPEDFASEFEPNTRWFIEQAFATFSDISLDVRPDVMYLTVYETTDYGDSIGYDKAPLDITEQVATELRQRIANRAICN